MNIVDAEGNSDSDAGSDAGSDADVANDDNATRRRLRRITKAVPEGVYNIEVNLSAAAA